MTTLIYAFNREINISSFIIVIYDANLKELNRYQVPFTVASPFANRLFKEVPQVKDLTVKEPWYLLKSRTDRNFQRSLFPAGPTSLYGKPFDPAGQTAPVITMHPEAIVRAFDVTLQNFQTELYQGVYTVDDIFLHGAYHLLHDRIKQGEIPAHRGPYYYAIIPSEYPMQTVEAGLLPEDAYQIDGIFHLPPRAKKEPRITFRRVAEDPLPERDPADFGPLESLGKGEPQQGRVLIPRPLYDQLRRDLSLGRDKEEGGYLLGRVYRLPGSAEQPGQPGFSWLVEITRLLMARGAVGTVADLVFTGDSWSDVSRERTRTGLELLGWFHTHLFPATDSFGLSGLDQNMHAWYLPRPWQVAILLNFEEEGGRTVRCYQRGPAGDLVETPFEIFDPDDGQEQPADKTATK